MFFKTSASLVTGALALDKMSFISYQIILSIMSITSIPTPELCQYMTCENVTNDDLQLIFTLDWRVCSKPKMHSMLYAKLSHGCVNAIKERQREKER